MPRDFFVRATTAAFVLLYLFLPSFPRSACAVVEEAILVVVLATSTAWLTGCALGQDGPAVFLGLRRGGSA